jgi:shikimate kinase
MLVFLIGFMGSGKSTTGRQLARKLGYGFLDTDARIAEQYGMSINEIFETLGEARFRETESRLLEYIIERRNLVISTGGGLPCYGRNMEIIRQNGVSVYLRISPADLYLRLSAGRQKRPLIRDLSGEDLRSFIEKKLSEREIYYEKADYTVDGINTDVRSLAEMLRR